MALDVFAQYATDETLENNGTWVEIGGGAKLLIARSGNRKYLKMLGREVERHKKVLDAGDDAADDKNEQIMIDVLASTILLGWEGITFKGKALEYSVDNARKLLALRDFRAMVARLADDIEHFRIKEEAEQGEA